MSEELKIEVTLSPAQHDKLKKLAEVENCSLESLVSRGVDTLVASYLQEYSSRKEHSQLLKMLTAIMKMLAQNLYYSSLPLTSGPVKSRLSNEGVFLHWEKSKEFANQVLGANPKKTDSQAKTGST